MALRDPNPRLAGESLLVEGRVLADDTSGGSKFAAGSTATFPAVATMQVLNREGLVNRAGTTLSQALWDVLIFSDPDPGVVPQKTKMTVLVQDRILIATTPSTRRGAGCWYVLAKSID